MLTDYEQEHSTLRLTEVEEVMWQVFVLRQQRRHDDANSLDRCLTRLKELGKQKLKNVSTLYCNIAEDLSET